MQRRARIKHGGEPHHIIQRGNNRSACFFSEEDYRFYLESVAAVAARYHCVIHAYMLMTNHVHLLATSQNSEGLPLMMRYLGSRYVRYVNSVYQRSGTLWGGRYKSSVIDSERYLLTCCRYIEFNPVRAGIVATPADYPWSSYGTHANGRPDDLLREHSCYLDLGKDNRTRQEAYRALFNDRLDSESLATIRAAVNSGLVLDGERFKDQIEAVLSRSVRAGKPGRPNGRRTPSSNRESARYPKAGISFPS
jgi:putative transposase